MPKMRSSACSVRKSCNVPIIAMVLHHESNTNSLGRRVDSFGEPDEREMYAQLRKT